jgi:hemolysin III
VHGTIEVVTMEEKPRLRGVFHEWAFFGSLGAAALLLVLAGGTREVVASSVYVAALAAMFGASALYHRISWAPGARAWLRRLDHSTIFLFIAGTYTPFALLALRGTLGWVLLTIAWAGAMAGMLLSLLWIGAPKWVAALVYIALGWAGVVAAPQLLVRAGVAVVALVAIGGIAYTLGAVAYATHRPNPWPRTLGYHEIFHLLVIAAAAAQFVAVALVVA